MHRIKRQKATSQQICTCHKDISLFFSVIFCPCKPILEKYHDDFCTGRHQVILLHPCWQDIGDTEWVHHLCSPTLPTTDDVRANGHFSTKWLHDHKKNTQCFCPQGFIFLQWMAPAFCWTVQIMVRLKTYCQADFSDKSSPAPAGTSTSTTQQTKLLTQQSFAESGGNLHWLREKLFKLSKKNHWTFSTELLSLSFS